MKSTTVKKVLQIEVIISAFIKRAGESIAWLNLLMMALTFLTVLLRYLFDFGSIALQEMVIYLHAGIFLLTAGYTLQANRHVRVDLFYRKFSTRGKALVDLFGTLFLLMPCLIFILITSWDYIAISWKIKEHSGDAGGLPFVYLLKSLIIALVILLGLQGFADIIRNLSILFRWNSTNG